MAGLFLSHSSADKPFVQRLAIDLVNRGMPVWYDSWEMGTGDSLHDRIYDGIGDSDYVMIVLSPNSVSSDWVNKELKATLALEDRRGRSFVLPIRLANCDVPLAIADRLYADFSCDYLEPLEALVARLERLGVRDIDEPPEHALVPLIFEKGIYLDGVQLEQRIDSLLPRLPAGFEFRSQQFVVAPDEQYAELRRRMIRRKEGIVDDPYYSPSFSRNFSQRYAGFRRLERQLIEGIAMIVNGYVHHRPAHFDVGIACHWFARAVRAETLDLLWSSQNPDLPHTLDYGSDCSFTTEQLLEVDETFAINVGPAAPGAPGPLGRHAAAFMAYIDANSVEARNIKDAIICSVASVGTWELYSKYLIPRMVRLRLNNADSPLSWTFDGWLVGPY